MKKRPVFNLEFPSWCPEINIFGYRFTRVSDYKEKVMRLQHLGGSFSEFEKKANTGTHSHTAYVEIPEKEQDSVLEWAGSNNSALMDILLLLSIFTGRDVFATEPEDNDLEEKSIGVIIRDPRVFQWGGILQCSIPYKKKPIEPEPYGYDIGFEEGINQIYKVIRSEEWLSKYQNGYFLFLVKMAFRRQALESTFILCWTIWEHLFAVLNRQWLSSKQIRQLSSVEKVSFILVRYALVGEIDNYSRNKIESLAAIRNRLIHFGRFPEHGKVHDDAILFIRLTEFVIAKILGLSPSNVFNTVERLEEFLSDLQQKSN
jgi:hypothetical protein